MASSFGISTENLDGSDVQWPGIEHELTDLSYSHTWPGGPSSMTCRLVVPDGYSSPAIALGRIVRLWRGADNVWSGVLTQPDTGGQGLGLTATGLASLASRWVAAIPGAAKVLDDYSSSVSTVSGGPFSITGNNPYEGLTCLSADGAGTFRRTFSTPQNLSGYQYLSFRLANPQNGPHAINYSVALRDSGGITWTLSGYGEFPGFYAYSYRYWDISTGAPSGFNLKAVASYTMTVDFVSYIDNMLAEPPYATSGIYAPFADQNIDDAIARGIPWRRMGDAPITYTGVTSLGGNLKALLDSYAENLDSNWSVDALGRLTWNVAPTTPIYQLYALSQGGARTVDGFATDVYAIYNIVQGRQLDDCSSQVSTISGAAWAVVSDHPYEGDSCASATGSTVGRKEFPTEQNLQDYLAITFRLANPLGGPQYRNYTLVLIDHFDTRWTLGSGAAALPGNWVWSKRMFALTGAPGNFKVDRVAAWELTIDGVAYIDDFRLIPPSGPIQRITPVADNAKARAKYGRWETSIDLTGQGALNLSEASATAAQGLARYGYRARWTQPFIATHGFLTTTGGVPVDLATVTAGSVVRIFAADLGAPEPGETFDALDVLIGETTYDEDAGTLQLTPAEAERKDLITLLGRLPKHRGS